MNTALTTLNGHEELSEMDQMILSEMESDEHAYDFVATRIRMPSGGVNAFTTAGGDILQPPLVGIVAISQKARAYWPDLGTGSPPLCSSIDGIHGWMAGEPDEEQLAVAKAARVKHPAFSDESDEAGPYACTSCPLAQWQSAPEGGRGQACKTLRRLVLLLDDFRMPVLLTLPPTSVRIWDNYCSGLASRSSAYFAVRTRFDLDRVKNAAGIDYAVVKVSVAGRIEESTQLEAVIEIRKQYADLVRSMEVTATEYQATQS